ncbi:TetR/AcrR family transcriptional regulator [Paracraurococcus lichenis]|uniref:Helix-turn-helix domain-containing protein n=1 Tax=Paracraurococcus lichenis TaxID=3064888 RepID=A0ABT9DUN2_9PROT|nr:TetR/AcrR family transcriptional regulator [Paracraurococcus sp. LOR1-02]MDO9707505.1 helix-turn-helix domain-containing protein [Paracraurococcus sp. LOR1-02]
MSAVIETAEAGRRAQTKARNREAILAAARRVFAELGYEAASVRDIIRRTNLASGTFYNYFRSKEEIARALAADAAERLRPLLRAERERAADLEGWLDGVIGAYFRYLVEDYGGHAAALPHVRIDATPAQRAVFEEVRESLTRILGDRLAPQADMAYLTAGAIGIARYVGEQMLRRTPPDPDGAARIAVRLILHGLPAAARTA